MIDFLQVKMYFKKMTVEGSHFGKIALKDVKSILQDERVYSLEITVENPLQAECLEEVLGINLAFKKQKLYVLRKGDGVIVL